MEVGSSVMGTLDIITGLALIFGLEAMIWNILGILVIGKGIISFV